MPDIPKAWVDLATSRGRARVHGCRKPSHGRDESVDLVYLDPPFKSNATYIALFEEHGEKAAAHIQAFEDTWEWTTESRAAYEEIVEAGGRVADAMRAFHTMLGTSDMMAYLAMMAPRLI